MKIKDYQKQAMTTCMESSKNVPYMALNLAGEVGELLEKLAAYDQLINDDRLQNFIQVAGELGALAKLIRKGEADYPISPGSIVNEIEIAKEIGDVMWQISGLCSVVGWDATAIAQMNLDKLATRQAHGCIDGNGDKDVRN